MSTKPTEASTAKPARRPRSAAPAKANVPTPPAASAASTSARRGRPPRPVPAVEAAPPAAGLPITITCPQAELREALAVVSRALAAKSTLPILQHVLLRSDGQCLTLHASDLRMMISWTLPTPPSGVGAVTLPAKLLADFVAALPNTDLELTCDPEAQTTVLRCAGSAATIKGWDVSDFPLPPPLSGTAPTFAIDAAALREALAQVVFAAATEETRPVLTGVLVELHATELRLSATNGFLLAVKTVELEVPVATPQRLIIPAVALAELGKILPPDSTAVRFTVAASGDQLVMETAHLRVQCRLIDGTFPDVQRVIPTHAATRVVLARDEVRQAVRQAAVFAASSAHATRLTIDHRAAGQGRVQLAAQAAELGDTAATLAAQITGAAQRVGLSSRFLKEVLGVLPTPEIALELEQGLKPVVFRPVGDDSLLIVVMPLSLSN